MCGNRISIKQKAEAQRRAQREALRTGVGVNDGHGNIWYPPSACDKGAPVRQPDYGHRCKAGDQD